MSQLQRWSSYTIQQTTTFNSATPAASPSAWGTDLTQSGFDVAGISGGARLGALFTLVGTPTTFAGVKVKLRPTYTTPEPVLEIWLFVTGLGWDRYFIGSVGQQNIALGVVANPNGGVRSGEIRTFDLLLRDPQANVTQVWVTMNPVGGGATNEFGPIHLYELVENTNTADPFDPTTGNPPFVSVRPRGTTPSDIRGGKYANFFYSHDLTPDGGDDAIDDDSGAWGLGDIPATVTLDFADELGNDVLLVAINDGLYILDWEQYRDEWNWDQWAPLYTLVESVPIPSVPDERFSRVRPGGVADPYSPEWVKRFRTLLFELAEDPTDAKTRFRLTVQETNQLATARSGTWTTRRRNRAQIAVSGLSFTWKLEHAANELFRPLWWEVQYDLKGPQIRESAVAV